MSAAKAKNGGSRRWLALILLCVAQFVDVLDINAVIVALPTIGRELGFSHGDLQWVVTSYVLLFGGFLLLAGRLADLFGRRKMFAVGLALFAASSLLCGYAWSPLALVVFRAAQGLGAAIVAPAALSIISTTFPEGRERNFAMGLWTAVAAGGGAAGLVLGGLITDVLGWEWIFFVNVPLGAAGVALSFVLLEADRGERTSRRLDLPGALTVTVGLVLLVYGLTRAEESGFGSPLTLATIVLALGLIATFLFVEHSVAAPRLPGAGSIWLSAGGLREHGDDQPGGHHRGYLPAGGPGLLSDPGGAFRVALQPLGRGRLLPGLPAHGDFGGETYHGAGAGGHLWRDVAHHRNIRRGRPPLRGRERHSLGFGPGLLGGRLHDQRHLGGEGGRARARLWPPELLRAGRHGLGVGGSLRGGRRPNRGGGPGRRA